METDSLSTMPDSTTKERTGFSEGEDVLLQQRDGRFYLGTVVLVELSIESCLVKFGDDTQRWSKFKELTRLSTTGSERPSCVVCKKSTDGQTPKDSSSNEILQCDKCGRGYHQLCHQPKIANAKDSLICQRCTTPQKQQKQPVVIKQGAARKQGSKTCKGKESMLFKRPLKLPYDSGELTWDMNHRTNIEQRYCYCGKQGEWFMQMMQCARCRQWFHEHCLGCLKYPLFCGDRFYLFVCAICNGGEEFIRRLELSWVDLVHVALYNLTVIYAKKYYDLDTMIVPYINERWIDWQLSDKIYNSSMKERRDQILSVLQNDKIRFKCGREIKKKTSIWGLRNRLPPYAPTLSLPHQGAVDDETLKRLCEGNRRLRFVAPQAENNSPTFRLPPTLTETPPALNGESGNTLLRDSPGHLTSPPVLTPEGKKTQSMCGSLSPDERDEIESDSDNSEPTRRKKRLRQCQVERQRRRQRWREQHRRAGLRLLEGRKQSQQVSSSSASLMHNSATNADKIKVDPDVSLLMAKKARKLVKNAISKGQHKHLKCSSPSPSSESTPQTTSILPVPCSTPAESSGDETSSRGTLDIFIPPPKDFEGANNPFSSLQTSTPAATPPPSSSVSLPPPLPPPANQVLQGRPTKRQLSERDIRIGKNGEVKRRRFRRRNGLTTTKIPPGNVFSRLQHDTAVQDTVRLRPAYQRSSKIASQQPPPSMLTPVTSRSGSTCVADALNSGRLRSRASSNKECPESPSLTPSTSSSSSELIVSFEEIKSSLNHYFGAANRIASEIEVLTTDVVVDD